MVDGGRKKDCREEEGNAPDTCLSLSSENSFSHEHFTLVIWFTGILAFAMTRSVASCQWQDPHVPEDTGQKGAGKPSGLL